MQFPVLELPALRSFVIQPSGYGSVATWGLRKLAADYP